MVEESKNLEIHSPHIQLIKGITNNFKDTDLNKYQT
jgi:hypothetical protein